MTGHRHMENIQISHQRRGSENTMNRKYFASRPRFAAALAAALMIGGHPLSAAQTSISTLAGSTHFHGIAVDAGDPSRLYLATHHGVYAVALNGGADRTIWVSRRTPAIRISSMAAGIRLAAATWGSSHPGTGVKPGRSCRMVLTGRWISIKWMSARPIPTSSSACHVVCR